MFTMLENKKVKIFKRFTTTEEYFGLVQMLSETDIKLIRITLENIDGCKMIAKKCFDEEILRHELEESHKKWEEFVRQNPDWMDWD